LAIVVAAATVVAVGGKVGAATRAHRRVAYACSVGACLRAFARATRSVLPLTHCVAELRGIGTAVVHSRIGSTGAARALITNCAAAILARRATLRRVRVAHAKAAAQVVSSVAGHRAFVVEADGLAIRGPGTIRAGRAAVGCVVVHRALGGASALVVPGEALNAARLAAASRDSSARRGRAILGAAAAMVRIGVEVDTRVVALGWQGARARDRASGGRTKRRSR